MKNHALQQDKNAESALFGMRARPPEFTSGKIGGYLGLPLATRPEPTPDAVPQVCGGDEPAKLHPWLLDSR